MFRVAGIRESGRTEYYSGYMGKKDWLYLPPKDICRHEQMRMPLAACRTDILN